MNERIEAYLNQYCCIYHYDSYGEMVKDEHYFMYREDFDGLKEIIIKDVLSEVYDEIQYTFSAGIANDIDDRLKKLYGVE